VSFSSVLFCTIAAKYNSFVLGVRVSHIWWQRWDPLPAGRRQGPLVDAAAAASEQSSVEARATAGFRVRERQLPRKRERGSEKLAERV